ncbi:MAG: hypothetical protein HKN90_00855 [Flavobacteriaceae bacterium]|nr:hypothetical protein [Flavobacteriaceae bacterium]
MLKEVNLRTRLLRERNRNIASKDVNSWVQSVFNELERNRENIRIKLTSSVVERANDFNFDKVESNKIFHIDQIKKICIDYRLRFLDTKYFKGDFPENAISEIRQLEHDHNIKLNGFKIVAPSKLFVLKKADDPLLFAPMGNGYYYLIYTWGKDLHPLRRIIAWPTKNVGNLAFTLFFSCIFLTAVSANFIFNQKATGPYSILLFLFYFKFAVGFLLFYGIASGKNFNEYIWRSKYNKIS